MIPALHAQTAARVNGVLAQIEDVLMGDDTTAAHLLWDVLTALRGPDMSDPGERLKMETSAALRTLTFPRLASRGFFFATLTRDEPQALIDRVYAARARLWSTLDAQGGAHEAAISHFSAHLSFAIDALQQLGLAPERTP